MNKAVFLDRDGVLIAEKHYLHRPEEVEVITGAAPALKRLQTAGYRLIVVTNQSGVGRGYFTLADVEKVHDHLRAMFRLEGVSFDKIYIAPEAPEQPSRGRKPSPQFVFDARDEFGLDLSQCFMIGDKLTDLECGWNAGVRQSLLVLTGYGGKTAQENADQLSQAIIVKDLPAAAAWILRNPQSKSHPPN